MKIEWWLFTDTNNGTAAEKLLQRAVTACELEISDLFDLSIDPYDKGGHRIAFSSELSVSDWPSVVIETRLRA